MASVIEARDVYTGGHLWRVSQYAKLLAEAAGLTSEMVFLAGLGGFLFDIYGSYLWALLLSIVASIAALIIVLRMPSARRRISFLENRHGD